MTPRAWAYNTGFLWFGIYLYELWGRPDLSHECAMELMAMEANR